MLIKVYPLDELIHEYLLQRVTPGVFQRYLSIINLINTLNQLEINNNILDISNMEAELLDIIFGEDEERDTKNDRVRGFFLNTVIRYINRYGIFLDSNIKLMYLEAVLDGLHTILTIDSVFIPELVNTLNNTENGTNEEILTYVLMQYSDIEQTALLELITDMTNECIPNIISMLNRLSTDKTPVLSEDILVLLDKLNTISEEFKNTYIVTSILTNGYTPFTIDKVLNDLYTNIERYNDLYNTFDINRIAYEIVATFYIADDTRNNILLSIHDKFIYENVTFLNNDAKGINNIKLAIEALLTAIN